MTTEHPAASAGATTIWMLASGWFHVRIAATTPTGSSSVKSSAWPGAIGMVSPVSRSIQPAWYSNAEMPAV